MSQRCGRRLRLSEQTQTQSLRLSVPITAVAGLDRLPKTSLATKIDKS
jgi:hypothetical protein